MRFVRAAAPFLIASMVAAAIHCSSSTSTSCSSVSGPWSVSGGCGTLQCRIAQSGCSLTIDCTLVSYTGTISGGNLFFESFAGDGGVTQMCSGTLAGNMVNGSCSTGPTSCTYSAVSQ